MEFAVGKMRPRSGCKSVERLGHKGYVVRMCMCMCIQIMHTHTHTHTYTQKLENKQKTNKIGIN